MIESEYTEWLEGLRPGDVVAESCTVGCRKIAITRVTKTQIVSGIYRYSRRTGRPTPKGYSWSRLRLEQWTDAHETMRVRLVEIRRLQDYPWDDLADDQRREVLAVIGTWETEEDR